MVEEIGKILSKGFETYTKNLNMSIPFILNVLVTGLIVVVMLFGGLYYIFGSSLSSLENATTPEQVLLILLPVISQHIFEILALIVLYFLIAIFFQSFFMAGAIGMAQQALETEKSDLSSMVESGKKNAINLFLAEILVGLIILTGIVFLVPGAVKDDLSHAILSLTGGILLWVGYMMILDVVLAVFTYALVIDNLGPTDGIIAGFRFFNKYKLDVFLLWLIATAMGTVIGIIGQIIVYIPVHSFTSFLINFLISSSISALINALILAPLTTVWWTRLYLTRKL